MLKDTAVLEIDNYHCKILNYDRLPVSLRYKEVSFDDVMHGWTESRTMNIGKTNAKKILAGFKMRQSNPYTIAELFHFSSLSDCYWMKESNENICWEDVNLFKNDFEKAVSATALLGKNAVFDNIKPKIHTPELTAQGMAAKAWIRESEGLYLYKVGKKELAASAILEALNIPHVSYVKVSAEQLSIIADKSYIEKIKENKEWIVKCKIISSEEISIFPWEDFQIYCSYHQINEFEYIKEYDGQAYYLMQIADYILGNEDRHGANFGFFMDNGTGKILNLYPLMDHDHAFSDDSDIPSQTSEFNESLRDAAMHAIKHVIIDFSGLFRMSKPKELTKNQWLNVLDRVGDLIDVR